MLQIYAQSTQYVEVPVTNAQGVNPTADSVQFAFLGPAVTTPQANELTPTNATTYYPGSWQSTTSPYVATILVGPNNGGVLLTAGCYLVVLKITDNPEIPVLFSGPLVVS